MTSSTSVLATVCAAAALLPSAVADSSKMHKEALSEPVLLAAVTGLPEENGGGGGADFAHRQPDPLRRAHRERRRDRASQAGAAPRP